ncbi:TlpA family protein disulfide reductase [Polaribacter butkevichii]|nr:TlpA disulfide reductase family protein [Polaribacter butkevichii]
MKITSNYLNIVVVCFFTLLMFSFCTSKDKSTATVEQLTALHNNLLDIIKSKTADSTKTAASKKVIDSFSQVFSFNKLSLSQIKTFNDDGILYKSNALRKELQTRLAELAKSPDIEGAKAASIATVNFPIAENGDQKDYDQNIKWAETYKNFVNHPAIGQLLLLEDNMSTSPFGRLQFLNPKAIGDSNLLQEIVKLLDMPMSKRAAHTAFILFKTANETEVKLSENDIQYIRKKCLKVTTNAITEEDIKKNTNIVSRKKFLSGAYAKHTLLNNPAPELNINWISKGNETELSDFKGKVVILDFWATWCSPCIASFPNIRKLEERYKNYPVEIIGVTSLQGYHLDKENKKRIPAKDQPEIEYEGMPSFMTFLGMTWKVAFTEQEEFNPDFGVTGIPHVAIIDPKGVVRYNMLRPYHAPYLEAEKIDKLLEESGLPFPKDPMTKENYSNVKD